MLGTGGYRACSQKLSCEAENVSRYSQNLEDLFGYEISCFSREAPTTMAAFNLHNNGKSDKATEIIITGPFRALFYYIGFKWDHASLGKCCASQQSIARSDLNLATDFVMKVI